MKYNFILNYYLIIINNFSLYVFNMYTIYLFGKNNNRISVSTQTDAPDNVTFNKHKFRNCIV